MISHFQLNSFDEQKLDNFLINLFTKATCRLATQDIQLSNMQLMSVIKRAKQKLYLHHYQNILTTMICLSYLFCRSVQFWKDSKIFIFYPRIYIYCQHVYQLFAKSQLLQQQNNMDQKYQDPIYRRQSHFCDLSVSKMSFSGQKYDQFKSKSHFSDVGAYETKQSLSGNHKNNKQNLNFGQIFKKGQQQANKKHGFENIKTEYFPKTQSNIGYKLQKKYNEETYEQFSFRIDDHEHSASLPFEQNGIDQGKTLVTHYLYAKVNKLRQANNKLSDQCIMIKKQLIKFQKYKHFMFHDFQMKITKKLIPIIEKERRQKSILAENIQKLLIQVEKAKKHQYQNQTQIKELKKKLEECSFKMNKFSQQVTEAKRENNILIEQNEDYFNQVCQLQNSRINQEQTMKEVQRLKQAIKNYQKYIKQLQAKINQYGEINQHQIMLKQAISLRIDLQEKAKQNWNKFNSHFTTQGIFENVEQQQKLNGWRLLRQRTDKQIKQLLANQNMVYRNIYQSQAYLVHLNIPQIINLIKRIKNDIFDFINQKKDIFDFDKQQIQQISNISEECSRSFYNITSHLPKYQMKKHKSVKFLKQSIETAKTIDSTCERTEANQFMISPYGQVEGNSQTIYQSNIMNWDNNSFERTQMNAKQLI